jgi:hypothetical protein
MSVYVRLFRFSHLLSPVPNDCGPWGCGSRESGKNNWTIRNKRKQTDTNGQELLTNGTVLRQAATRFSPGGVDRCYASATIVNTTRKRALLSIISL